jgi:hypothetical protein
MSVIAACSAVAPAVLCRHADLLVYLVPSAALAFLIRLLAGAHLVFPVHRGRHHFARDGKCK